MRTKRLIARRNPTHDTGIPTAPKFMGRNGYKKASPKLANASASAAKADAFSPEMFDRLIYPQHAAADFAFGLASTPQHALVPALAPMSTLQTPVSGKSSSTFNAASISPSIAATIE